MSALQPRPTLGEPSPYTFPTPRRLTVGNGQVVAVDLPGQPYAAIRLIHPAGGTAEPAAHPGVATLTNEALEDGIDGNSSLVPQMERTGAEWVSRVSWDNFVTGVDAPVARVPDAVALFTEAVRRPALRPEDVERRRDQLVEQFVLEASVPSTLAGRAIESQLFTGRYAIPLGGGPVQLATLTPEIVADFHARQIAGRTGTLVVVGDLADIDLEAMGKAVFGDTAATPEPSRLVPEPAPGERPRVVVLHRPGSVQSALVLAHGAPNRREIELARAIGVSDVLGGMFSSRLNLELRERRGDTYGVGSWFNLRRDSGTFQVKTQVEGRATASSVEVMFEEIERLRAEGVTPDELTAVRESNTIGLPVSYSTSRAIANALIEMVVHDLPEDHVDRLRAGFERLTLDDLHQAARDLFRPDAAVVVAVGDAEQIADPLKQTGIGPVEIRDPETYWQ